MTLYDMISRYKKCSKRITSEFFLNRGFLRLGISSYSSEVHPNCCLYWKSHSYDQKTKRIIGLHGYIEILLLSNIPELTMTTDRVMKMLELIVKLVKTQIWGKLLLRFLIQDFLGLRCLGRYAEVGESWRVLYRHIFYKVMSQQVCFTMSHQLHQLTNCVRGHSDSSIQYIRYSSRGLQCNSATIAR